ncbi:MAG: hypothetical protein ACOVOR_05190 [Rhabdochlamydiaceae bacterium]
MAQANQPAWETWSALSFESTCYKHIDQIRKALKIDPRASSGTWRFIPKTKKQLFFSMITTMGLKPTMYSEELIASEVTLDDLFKDI